MVESLLTGRLCCSAVVVAVPCMGGVRVGGAVVVPAARLARIRAVVAEDPGASALVNADTGAVGTVNADMLDVDSFTGDWGGILMGDCSGTLTGDSDGDMNTGRGDSDTATRMRTD